MGKVLIIKGADFSANGISYSRIEGVPGTTLIPSIGSGSFTINGQGFCLIDDIVTPDSNGQFALGNYNNPNPNIYKIKAKWDVQASNITSFTQLFCKFPNLAEIDCTELNTNGITDFNHTFNSLSSIKRIDISTWSSNGNFAQSSYMFNACQSLEWIDLGQIIFNNSTTTTFNACNKLTKVRTHLAAQIHINYIKSVLDAANAGGSNNWIQGTDDDGCIMFTPSV